MGREGEDGEGGIIGEGDGNIKMWAEGFIVCGIEGVLGGCHFCDKGELHRLCLLSDNV